MTDLAMSEINGITMVWDFIGKRAFFRDSAGNVRFAPKDPKRPVSGKVRKTDKKRNPETQARIDAIWDMLHGPDVKIQTS